MKKILEKIPIPILQQTLQSMLLGGDGDEGGGERVDLKKVSFAFVLFGGGKYRPYACSALGTNF